MQCKSLYDKSHSNCPRFLSSYGKITFIETEPINESHISLFMSSNDKQYANYQLVSKHII